MSGGGSVTKRGQFHMTGSLHGSGHKPVKHNEWCIKGNDEEIVAQ